MHVICCYIIYNILCVRFILCSKQTKWVFFIIFVFGLKHYKIISYVNNSKEFKNNAKRIHKTYTVFTQLLKTISKCSRYCVLLLYTYLQCTHLSGFIYIIMKTKTMHISHNGVYSTWNILYNYVLFIWYHDDLLILCSTLVWLNNNEK